MIKAILVDLGGVVNTLVSNRSITAWEKKLGLKTDELYSISGNPEIRGQWALGKITEDEMWTRLFTNLNLSSEEQTNLRVDLRMSKSRNSELIKCLSGLRPNIRIGIHSNAGVEVRKGLMYLDGIADAIIISADIGMAKPDPKFYKFLVEQLGNKPHEMLFIDDNLESVEAAKKAGMIGIHFTNNTKEVISEIYSIVKHEAVNIK
jgi:putative hydrolase of the HAD superfamily